MKKAIMYLNQFFGQIGGEDKANFKPEIREGVVGPSIQMEKLLEDTIITHTIICGDNYMGSNTDDAINKIIDFIKDKEFDIFIAGPAFQAGRYGVACGQICKVINEKLGKPVITSMHSENPGVEMFKNDIHIVCGGNSAGKMRRDLAGIAKIVNKILRNEKILDARTDGYFGRGIRHQVWLDDEKTASKRAVDMLIKKLNNEKYETELPIPKIDRVKIAPPIEDLSKSTIALVNTGGIVPVDNPDRIQSASATRWGRYDISNVDDLKSGIYKTIHAGFDPAVADDDPDVITPIDVLKLYENEGRIGKLHEYFYTTVGTGTTQAEAVKMAKEIIPYLKESKVDGIIMVST